MTDNTIGKIPEFSTSQDESYKDEPVKDDTGIEEVKDTPVEKPEIEEKETPAELPAVEQPAQEGEDTGDLQKAVDGLQKERAKLLAEVRDLRGTKRDIKQEELFVVDNKLDELNDLNPDDVELIEKVIKAKGYVTKEDSDKKWYDTIKQDELDKFLDKYPEYKADNDPDDINWSTLQRELGYYVMPKDPRQLGEVLKKAHSALNRSSSGRDTIIKKQQIETASVGSKGIQRSSSGKSLPEWKKRHLEEGGWSEEDISELENKLT